MSYAGTYRICIPPHPQKRRLNQAQFIPPKVRNLKGGHCNIISSPSSERSYFTRPTPQRSTQSGTSNHLTPKLSSIDILGLHQIFYVLCYKGFIALPRKFYA